MSKIPIKSPDIHLVTVYTVNDPVKAELIRNTLVDHDIHCRIDGEHQAGFTGALSVDIIVRQADATLAKQIIKDHNLL